MHAERVAHVLGGECGQQPHDIFGGSLQPTSKGQEQ